jgi:hypothetical protein
MATKPPNIPYSIGVPGGAPNTLLGVAGFLSQLVIALNQWVYKVANALNNVLLVAGPGTVTEVNTGTGLAGGPITEAGTISLAASGIAAGTYQGITFNTEGQATSASNESYLTANQTITLAGDASGSGTTAITATLATVNSNTGTFSGLTVNGKGLVTAALVRASATKTVASPVLVTGSTFLMQGLNLPITPNTSGQVFFSISGNVVTGTAATLAQIQGRYGSGGAPSNGGTLTGTQTGLTLQSGSTAVTPFCLSGIIFGLTAGTAYWIDLALANNTAGDTATLTNVFLSAVEIR